ncbi:hypothetical protein C5D07_02010 [Rathayibacter tritici]|uniref:nucleotide disphospho-sugar-binding domain-containing protein n=1 Tax=Rathayibacter tritici TaxID=33888 RepID=UPI000CE792C6|nr:nucleotide disphospho-sugar-binding domain-containing protein [Rathayibacter tritici]PPF23703.1 hypothetical protein C5C06_13820 [Rathayibacter tritici]PPI19325.1 hypothetical protein C5D07_02010 [Rathayibacter tritici]
MSSIALMTLPLHGHVNPMLGLAAELVGRGHDVTFATGTDFAAAVERTGARAVVYQSVLRSSRTGVGCWVSGASAERDIVDVFAAERDAALAALGPQYRHAVPEIVVFDTVTAFAPILTSRWGVPLVQFSPTHVLPPEQPSHGATPAAADANSPCIVALPRSFQYPDEGVGHGHVFVGPLDWERDGDADWQPSNAARTTLVSLGTTFNDGTDLMRRVARVISEVKPGTEVVVALGRPVTRELGAGWPESVRLESWVPQQRVLREVDLFVTAGGTGSVLEAIRASTPMVVLPQAVEQFVNARQVRHLGLGTALTPDAVDDDALAAAVNLALSLPGFGEAARQLNDEMASAGGAATAAAVVEGSLLQLTGRLAP